MLHITLTRQIATGETTMGVMTCDKTDIRLFTQEDRLPHCEGGYVSHLLPPGDYPCRIVKKTKYIDDVPCRLPALEFLPIRWFPKAEIVEDFERPRYGIIKVANARENDFHLSEDTRTSKILYAQFVIALEAANDPDIVLTIVEDHDTMTINRMSEDDMQAYEAERIEKEKREKIMKEVYGTN